MDLSILIVTYNSGRLIEPLLSQLRNEIEHPDFPYQAEVVVVDNDSKDDTIHRIRAHHPWVHLLPSIQNLGFAAGNNLAAKHANGRYLMLLNPDAVPQRGALATAISRMDAHPEAGLAGGELLNTQNERQPSARMFPTLRDEIFTMSGLAARFPNSPLLARMDRRWADPEMEAEVDWIPGAFVIIPARVWNMLKGFDERFFMYYEEVDMCRRIKANGLQVLYWPTLKATHIGGASAKTVQQARVSRAGSQLESWRMRSAMLYYRKHHGLLGAWGLLAVEWSWHRMRALRAAWRHQTDKQQDLTQHCTQLRQAWLDTRAGAVSPAKPW